MTSEADSVDYAEKEIDQVQQYRADEKRDHRSDLRCPYRTLGLPLVPYPVRSDRVHHNRITVEGA